MIIQKPSKNLGKDLKSPDSNVVPVQVRPRAPKIVFTLPSKSLKPTKYNAFKTSIGYQVLFSSVVDFDIP